MTTVRQKILVGATLSDTSYFKKGDLVVQGSSVYLLKSVEREGRYMNWVLDGVVGATHRIIDTRHQAIRGNIKHYKRYRRADLSLLIKEDPLNLQRELLTELLEKELAW